MLYDDIKIEIKEAMKTKNIEKRDVLKMVINKARLIEKEKNPNKSDDNISDAAISRAVKKELKQLNQTKDSLKGKEKTNLYCSTECKIEYLNRYLNSGSVMSREDIRLFVENEIKKLDNVNKGSVMKIVMPQLKDKADGKIINEVVDNVLKFYNFTV